MNVSPQVADDQQAAFFRCPVQTEHSNAVIRIGRRKAQAKIQDSSIDGFTVLVSRKHSSKLKVGRPWILEYEGARFEVHPQWVFNAPDGRVQMALRRLRDVTPTEPDKKSLLIRFGGKRYEDPSCAAAVYGGLVLFLFALMALPGLGDELGTSTRIQNAFRSILQSLNSYL